MKRLLTVGVAAVLVLLLFLYPLCAADTDMPAGEVLFAERYADYTDIGQSGLTVGTSSWKKMKVNLNEGELSVKAACDERSFLLFPSTVFTDSYTIIYTFRFTELLEPNGYIGFILTSTGEAPANRTELLIHANGLCSDVGQFSEALAASMTAGKEMTVTIPVEHGMLHKVILTDGAETETLELKNVRSVSAGGRGFSFRNCSVKIKSVEIVNGSQFTAKTGVYSTESYVEKDVTRSALIAPYTADGGLMLVAVGLLSAGLALRYGKKEK